MKLWGTPECIRNCKSLCFQDFCNSFVKMFSVDGDLIDAKGCIPSSGSKSHIWGLVSQRLGVYTDIASVICVLVEWVSVRNGW